MDGFEEIRQELIAYARNERRRIQANRWRLVLLYAVVFSAVMTMAAEMSNMHGLSFALSCVTFLLMMRYGWAWIKEGQ